MPESESKFPRVLIVDDDTILTRILANWLEKEGYAPWVCGNGEKALEILEHEDFEIVTLDWHMIGMNGLEVVKSIRARKGPGLPYVILATGDESKDAILVAFQAGIDDFVRKPLDRIEILARLQAARRVISLEGRLRENAGKEAIAGLHRGGIRELSEVVATLAHDLRTPLATLRMSASILLSRSESQAPELLPTVERIDRVSARMAETLDDLVSAFLADDGKSEIWTEFDLASEAARSVEMLSAAVPQGTMICLPEIGFRTRGNPFGLRRLVLNLISNALRHSGSHRIEMALSHDSDPDWIRLEVSDDGQGIQESLLAHLGEPMVLSSASSRQEFFVKGNGLGFTICRRIAAQHGGRIVVTSGPGGTTVRVWLRSRQTGPDRGDDLCPIETEFRP